MDVWKNPSHTCTHPPLKERGKRRVGQACEQHTGPRCYTILRQQPKLNLINTHNVGGWNARTDQQRTVLGLVQDTEHGYSGGEVAHMQTSHHALRVHPTAPTLAVSAHARLRLGQHKHSVGAAQVYPVHVLAVVDASLRV
jgi:hypothetical protein